MQRNIHWEFMRENEKTDFEKTPKSAHGLNGDTASFEKKLNKKIYQQPKAVFTLEIA